MTAVCDPLMPASGKIFVGEHAGSVCIAEERINIKLVSEKSMGMVDRDKRLIYDQKLRYHTAHPKDPSNVQTPTSSPNRT